jgi:UDP-glucuronate 4-epimerase
VTGGAGFIGSHLVDALLHDGWRVTVVDNFEPAYDRAIKESNLAAHRRRGNLELADIDVRDLAGLKAGLDGFYDVIVHLAARVGDRLSLRDPAGFQEVNAGGTQNLLECARRWGVRQFVYASSGSVYGVNPRAPWREDDCALLPASPYASSKIAGEALGHVYSHVYGIRFVALRLFTVYGPRQRPDMAIHRFAQSMLAGESVEIFGDGSSRRDYTFVADAVAGIRAAMDYADLSYEVINLGSGREVRLDHVLQGLEQVLDVKARTARLPDQAGDLQHACSSIAKAQRLLGYQPRTSLPEGLSYFASWLTGTSASSLLALHRALTSPLTENKMIPT